MAQILVDSGKLVVVADLLGRILHSRDSVTVPLTHVVSADARPEPGKGWFAHLRAMMGAGTHIPGLVQIGTFMASDGMVFYALRDGRRAIVIELEQERFKRLIVEPDRNEEPEVCAQRVRAAAAQARQQATGA